MGGGTACIESASIKLGVNLDQGKSSRRDVAMLYAMMGVTEKDEEGENRLVSNVYQPIPVQVTVTLNFEIQ